ncbi:hypothetical protein [Solimonas sp. K1W22B-7]|uniref:hypothetical protein n=1 Tax=Solimonas sp. K1W22B-7 TaxID=2303331 RepID=UPI0013C41D51|nr:hypothetical protein [Solimonas sp. K1W22B-7]
MKKMWIFVVVILLAAIAGGMLAGMWVFRNVDARLVLTDQPATVVLPNALAVSADVLNELEIEINSSITTTVPVNQRILIPLTDTLHVQASFDSPVPIKMNVPVRDFIYIDQVLDVDAVVKADLLGDTHDLPLRGKVPVKAKVPVSLNIPVDQMVHLKFTAPVDVKFKDPLDVLLKADIATTIPIHSKMSVPVKSALKANITVPDPADIIITNADLRLPLRTLRFGTGEAQKEAAAAAATAPPP